MFGFGQEKYNGFTEPTEVLKKQLRFSHTQQLWAVKRKQWAKTKSFVELQSSVLMLCDFGTTSDPFTLQSSDGNIKMLSNLDLSQNLNNLHY